ncbi:protease [Rhizocola hellebori]|uniref:Protease n=1 Tax=Rhizocola hellebori TaxID=1392758 RepID=A0A8J3VGW8_9ACTN|nr:S8 family serine peptidase [Rhizocola hellebori]GIH05622.1 protease [Rhizocola hellebori]
MQVLEDPYDRYRRQFQRIQRELRIAAYPDDEPVELDCDDLTRPTISYQRDHVIAYTGSDNVDFLEAHFDAARVGEARSGTQLMKVNGDAREIVERARAGRGRQSYSLNHLIAVAVGDVNLCPCDEPMLPPSDAFMYPDPSRADPEAGRGVMVDVIDTGLIRTYAEHRHLDGVEALGFRNQLGEGEFVPLDYGHGTFVTGVLRSVAPAVDVRVSRLLRRGGATTEFTLRDELEAVLHRDPPPDIVSLSAGNTSSDGHTMMALEPVVDRLHAAGIVLVAAAGNNGNDVKFFPAAFKNVIGVGATRRGARGRACFSNYGPWVSVYAPGERLVNAFVTEGRYRTVHEGRETCRFRGRREEGWYGNCTCIDTLEQGDITTFPSNLARWSGTSFATPIVAGLIAARLALARRDHPDTTPRQAADWLLRHADRGAGATGPLVEPGQQLVSRCGNDPDCAGDC